jgi:hypothetical protein
MRGTILRGSLDSGSRAMRMLSRWDVFRLLAGCVAACAASLAMAGDASPLAIKGYDPVAYFTAGTPTRGLQEFELDWDEQRYRFSSAKHRALFKADPVRYAPQFADYCAMALSKGELVEANPENWVIADDKLYIFGKQMGPGLFRQDVGGTVAKAERNRALTRKPAGDK